MIRTRDVSDQSLSSQLRVYTCCLLFFIFFADLNFLVLNLDRVTVHTDVDSAALLVLFWKMMWSVDCLILWRGGKRSPKHWDTKCHRTKEGQQLLSRVSRRRRRRRRRREATDTEAEERKLLRLGFDKQPIELLKLSSGDLGRVE